MADRLEDIGRQVGEGQPADRPPLERWHPPLSGDIDILILRDGTWLHEGRPIARPALVRLFSSILRCEEDGHYYLVTPVEKWRIRVEAHPLLVTDVEPVGGKGERRLSATLNTGARVIVGEDHPLFLDPAIGEGEVAALSLDHGLSALFSRAAWYRLVDMAEDRGGVPTVRSGDYLFALG